MSSSLSKTTGSRFAIGLLGILTLSTFVAYFVFRGADAPQKIDPDQTTVSSSDPRSNYAGPFLNVKPEVKEVGDAACAICHAGIADHFSRHPMGRSLLPIARVIDSLSLGKEAQNPFEKDGFEHTVRRDGDKLFHREIRRDDAGKVIFEREVEVEYAVGSGQKGYSFFSTHPGGYLYQTWISWYSQAKRWDISPGFSRSTITFQARPVLSGCVDCHANRVEPLPETVNHYREPIFRGHTIGCERCHGPGELHVKERESGQVVDGIDHSIVNPKHLPLEERESICQQCHLEGETRILHRDRKFNEFRPGMRLDRVMSVFITDHRGADRKAVNHVEQMYLSKCFTKSEGKMGCATCHDPHEQPPPEKRVAVQKANCGKCHTDCSVPLAARLEKQPDGYCVSCHMPRFSASDIVHTATTNHQILRFGDRAKPPPQATTIGQLLLFPSRPVNPENSEEVRDWALASMKAKSAPAPPTEALRRLMASLEKFPDDVELWLASAKTHEILGSPRQALEAYKQVLTVSPNHEQALNSAGDMAGRLGQSEAARDFWKRSLECNPWNWYAQAQLASLLIDAGKLEEARPPLEKWRNLNPGDPSGRLREAEFLWKRGEARKAEALFETIKPLAGTNWPEYERRWSALKPK